MFTACELCVCATYSAVTGTSRATTVIVVTSSCAGGGLGGSLLQAATTRIAQTRTLERRMTSETQADIECDSRYRTTQTHTASGRTPRHPRREFLPQMCSLVDGRDPS